MAQALEVGATSDLFARTLESPAVQSLARRLENGGLLSCPGISAAGHPFLAAILSRLFPRRPILAVADTLKAQEQLQQDIETLSNHSQDDTAPLFFPDWEMVPHESRLPHADVISERLETLMRLLDGTEHARAPLIVTNVVALLQKTFPPLELKQRIKLLNRGDRSDPLNLVEWLEDHGYEPEAQVTSKGEISLRGGILDVYPVTSPWPVRLEFFGDELESLRHFDPLTQKSRDEITAVTLPPAGELGVLKQLLAGQEPGPPTLASLLDYLPADTILLLCEQELLEQRATDYAQQAGQTDPFLTSWDNLKQAALDKGMTVLNLTAADEAWSTDGIEQPQLRVDSLEAFRPLSHNPPEPQVAEVQRREFFIQLHRWLRQGYEVNVFCNNTGERDRFQEIWKDYGLTPPGKDDSHLVPNIGPSSPLPVPSHCHIRLGTLSRGFLLDDARLVAITDAEIFGRYRVQRPRRLKSPHAQAARSALDIDFTELEEGDLVVHLQHGIGRFLGLTMLPIGAGARPTTTAGPAANQECLVIEYAPNDPAQPAPKLYVPVTEAHLVSKYVGAGKARPPLNMLGGTRWSKAKAQAERAVKDIASDLLAIQAAREAQAGHAFQPDTPWQREFESAFIYEETPDQLRSITETKTDMERPKPMDRLICGDVGFGKTEVAIRAAFKAVMDGRQVAVLVPTTVLAQQHFNTFRDRMADYPIRVDLLSRFRSRRDQQRIIRDLAAGGVDIVIGTHRLVQKDISFKDLGLVIIDEEQRFGVLHKEKFKMLRHLVDVLTLSATPIPRTLYLALAGARDMSTIQTPPHDRLPVQTVVTQYDERLIRDAIQRELNRAGQVFFLHNRISTIQSMAVKLQNLLPNARIVVGHGQMDSDQLEEVMTRFINGEADVLLSTTIIESGLDIPNANTIIIDRADRFGLSDLYQLRGRVGRYKHQAYAYLLLPRHARLLTDVRKRMSAIKQYATLGSGFKIAMRDLEIRGAGNLLGSEQSGHITAVGFELYCQLLKQSVATAKGEPVKPRVDVQVRLDFLPLNATQLPAPATIDDETSTEPDENEPRTRPEEPEPQLSASIPYTYISDARQRIEVYRKLAQATEAAALTELERELRDRFGPLPRPVTLLLMIGELKVLASQKGISVIEVSEDKLMLTRNGDFIMVGSKFPRLMKKTAEARLKEIRRLLMVL